MAFRAYELYYLDSYDEEVDDLVTMYDYDEDDYRFDDDIRWHIDCRFGVVGTASPRSWYRCSAYPVLRGGFFHS